MMNRSQFAAYFFIGLLVFVIWQVLAIFAPFSQSFFWASVISFAFYPVYDWLRRKMAPYETLAAILMTFIIFLVVIPPFILLIINLTSQAIELYQRVSDYIRQGELAALMDRIRETYLVQKLEAKVLEWEPLKQNATEWLLNSSRALGNFAATQAGVWTKNIFFIFLNMCFMFVLIFIFLKDGRRIYGFIYEILPLEENHKHLVSEKISETFAAVIRGQLLTGFVQATIAGTVFGLLGIPVPLLFGIATFIVSLIPILGAATIWFPLAVYLYISHQTVKAIILFAVGTLIISLADNVLKPALIGEKTKLPYFLLFFGILGAIKLYGITGIFLAPVVLTLFFVLIRIYQEKNW